MTTDHVTNGGHTAIRHIPEELKAAKAAEMKRAVLERIEEMKDKETFTRNEMIRHEQRKAKKDEMERLKRERKEAKLGTKRIVKRVEQEDDTSETATAVEEASNKKERPFLRYSNEEMMKIRENMQQRIEEKCECGK
jgi:(p)ppGpp synthase/HD superfamily hydrolase